MESPRPKQTLRWQNVAGIAAMHVGAFAAPFFFTWSGLGSFFVLWWLCGGLGVCLCYHRLLTHRSFVTWKPVEWFLAILGTLNWQGGPIKWVGTHRIHHKHSDQEEDPHTPHHGFGWAHVFWSFYDDPEGRVPQDAAKDLQRDPVLVFIDTYHYVPQFILAGLLFWVGGWSWMLWGCCFRVVFTYHSTWFVNSASHVWGYKNFQTGDDSRNNWWVAIVSFGEGWHNNHHAFQRSAAHGMKWWEIDVTYWTIRMMGWVGLARKIVRIDASEKHRHAFGSRVESDSQVASNPA